MATKQMLDNAIRSEKWKEEERKRYELEKQKAKE